MGIAGSSLEGENEMWIVGGAQPSIGTPFSQRPVSVRGVFP